MVTRKCFSLDFVGFLKKLSICRWGHTCISLLEPSLFVSRGWIVHDSKPQCRPHCDAGGITQLCAPQPNIQLSNCEGHTVVYFCFALLVHRPFPTDAVKGSLPGVARLQVRFSASRRDCRLWLDLKSFKTKSIVTQFVTDITIKKSLTIIPTTRSK
jgi:hypothetical protein